MLALLAPAAFAAPPPDAEAPAPPVVHAAWGQGLKVNGDDFSLQVRARAQLRAAVFVPGEEGADPEAAAMVRRLRLVMTAKNPSRNLQLSLQLGFAPRDMESDLMVPLYDAVATWTPLRDLGVRAGQMKVPFNRESVVSSSALQFVDRSVNNATLNLDRDIGVQLFSDDLFGIGGRLGYQLGVYNGDGRNRVVGDTGFLYVARVDVRPLGTFEDINAQADLGRKRPPRLDLGVAAARNIGTVRARSTSGDTLDVPFTYDHGAVDLVFKAKGFSLHGEAIVRRATETSARATLDDGTEVTATSGSAWGWSAQAGYVFPGGWEPVVRYATVMPMAALDGRAVPDEPAVPSETEARAGLNWYVQGHDLKVQLDAGLLGGDAHPDGDVEVRLQSQLFF